MSFSNLFVFTQNAFEMKTNLQKIKRQKTKEAELFYKEIGISINIGEIDPSLVDYYGYPFIAKNQEKEKSKLVWTRLSVNSNIGFTI